MRERSTDPLVEIDEYRNVTDLLIQRAAAAADHIAFDVAGEHADEPWRPVTTMEFLREVRSLAKGLMAHGVAVGDAVAIMAPTRYEWAVSDLAAWFAGAVVVPVYETSSVDQVTAIARDAAPRLGIAGSSAHAEALSRGFAAAGAGALGVWTMDEGERSLTALRERAGEVDDEELESRRTAADLDTPATYVYTSGTTGEPKGAILTHRNFVGQVLNIAAAYREVVREDGNTVIFLPLAHVLARGLQLICLASGMRIAHLADTSRVVGVLEDRRPTFLVVVPRVLEKIRAAAGAKAQAKRLGGLWRAAERTAISWGRAEETGVTPGPLLRARRALFDRLFYRRLRALMGGRLAYILSGGATLDAEVALLFRGMGAPVVEGYGLTETTAPLTGNLPGDIRAGTVGIPLPGSTVRIAEDGEILARGVGVFAGYRDPSHDAEAFVDGFFRTGDLGRLDEHGHLVLAGRVKDVIVTSGGKTVVPHAWEQAVESDPLVAHAIMVGEGRPYLSALLVLDPEPLAAWATAHGVALPPARPGGIGALRDSALQDRLQRVVDAANLRVSRAEQVRRFTIVVADLDDTRLVTPTMKIKRRALLAEGTDVLADLYR
ncbi:Long-chain-fatty-acid--CoA ligase FadD15 [Microbacterium sp. TNHR37B]|nr:AMP-dependent synthetase/ligase [Microbacterium sp. TNHR37B]KZE88684.1 Long-chain-fatty-acid--CoA ligase FadD15 [Microbacterium sp. TNHR37B]